MLEIQYTSADGVSPITAYIWTPPEGVKPKGILQIVHGFSEHMLRYGDFASFMTKNDYIVCGHDQLGHGKSGLKSGQIGKNGHKVLARDAYKLTAIMKKQYSQPVIIMGIGAGSLVARYAASLWSIEYSGAIFSGTMGCGFGVRVLQRVFSAAVFGNRWRQEAVLVNKIALSRHRSYFRKDEAGSNWLTRDAALAAAFEADPLCGASLSHGAYQTLLKLAKITNSSKWLDRIPKNLPIYLFSGLEDPVGGFGRGVINIYTNLLNVGCHNVDIRLYENARHEMLFELNREEVYEDVAKWLENLKKWADS